MNAKETAAVFLNTRAVVRAEAACREAGVPVSVMPVPEAVSSECGMCLVVPREERQRFARLMEALQIPVTYYEKD